MENAIQFDGPVYPVNPSASGTVFDREFVSSVTEINGEVDFVLCCVPALDVPDVIGECSEAGIGDPVIFAGGSREAGLEGRELQERLVGTAIESGVAVLGPNTNGYCQP